MCLLPSQLLGFSLWCSMDNKYPSRHLQRHLFFVDIANGSLRHPIPQQSKPPRAHPSGLLDPWWRSILLRFPPRRRRIDLIWRVSAVDWMLATCVARGPVNLCLISGERSSSVHGRCIGGLAAKDIWWRRVGRDEAPYRLVVAARARLSHFFSFPVGLDSQVWFDFSREGRVLIFGLFLIFSAMLAELYILLLTGFDIRFYIWRAQWRLNLELIIICLFNCVA